MSYQPVSSIHFAVTPDKTSEMTRYDRGIMITNQSPGSPLCKQHPDLKAVADEVIQNTVALKTAMDDHTKAMAMLAAARTALSSAVLQWDASYGVFVKTGEKYAGSANDAASLGAEARSRTINPLATPLSVDFTWDRKKDCLRVHVHRAPGMRAVAVELSLTPMTPESWFELDGNGAVHTYPKPAKGTWWVRAQSRTAKGKSDFTAPVSVIVT